MQTYVTPQPITAAVQVAGARVRVTASDRSDTAVLVEPIDPTDRSHVRVADRTKIAFVDGRLSVKTTVSGGKRGSVAISIDLPSESRLVAYLAHSDVEADGPLGECELHLASSRVRLARIQALHANVSSGDIAVGQIAGRAGIDGSAAEVHVGRVDGPVRLSTSGGRLWIGHASADLDLESARGEFDIDLADASVVASTGHGAIRIGRMTQGQAKLTNGAGDIEVGVAEDSVASIDIDSERGAVHDLVSALTAPQRSTREVRVHARTRHGDVVVRRSAG